MTSSNKDLARLFDAQYAEFDQDMPLWHALAAEHGSPILELGCGTGRVLLRLARAGFDVLGLDANPAMLSRTASRIDPDLADRVTLCEEDLRSFSLSSRYHLAIAPLNVLAELDLDGFTQALAAVRSHLEPGGVLAMDLPNPAQSLSTPSDEGEPLDHFVDPQTDNSIQVSARQNLLAGGQSIAVSWFYDELLPDGTVSRHIFETTFHLRDQETLRGLLVESGFPDVSLYGDYEYGAFDESSTRMIVIAAVR